MTKVALILSGCGFKDGSKAGNLKCSNGQAGFCIEANYLTKLTWIKVTLCIPLITFLLINSYLTPCTDFLPTIQNLAFDSNSNIYIKSAHSMLDFAEYGLNIRRNKCKLLPLFLAHVAGLADLRRNFFQ